MGTSIRLSLRALAAAVALTAMTLDICSAAAPNQNGHLRERCFDRICLGDPADKIRDLNLNWLPQGLQVEREAERNCTAAGGMIQYSPTGHTPTCLPYGRRPRPPQWALQREREQDEAELRSLSKVIGLRLKGLDEQKLLVLARNSATKYTFRFVDGSRELQVMPGYISGVVTMFGMLIVINKDTLPIAVDSLACAYIPFLGVFRSPGGNYTAVLLTHTAKSYVVGAITRYYWLDGRTDLLPAQEYQRVAGYIGPLIDQLNETYGTRLPSTAAFLSQMQRAEFERGVRFAMYDADDVLVKLTLPVIPTDHVEPASIVSLEFYLKPAPYVYQQPDLPLKVSGPPSLSYVLLTQGIDEMLRGEPACKVESPKPRID